MKKAEINDIKSNIMGTTSIEMKAGPMRKADDFIIYSIKKNGDAKKLRLQSGRYWAEIDAETGTGEISKGRNNANSWTFASDQAQGLTQKFKLKNVDLEALRLHVFSTASKKAGNSVMTSDNSGAVNILG